MNFRDFLTLAAQGDRLTKTSRLLTQMARLTAGGPPSITIEGVTFTGNDAVFIKRQLIDPLGAICDDATGRLRAAGIEMPSTATPPPPSQEPAAG